jgi:hypothetical protein
MDRKSGGGSRKKKVTGNASGGTWLALDNHVAAYYVESTEETGSNWTITGRIPALLNGEEDFDNSYFLGEQMVVSGDLMVSNVNIGEFKCMVTYRLTDIYNNSYWTPAVVYQN